MQGWGGGACLRGRGCVGVTMQDEGDVVQSHSSIRNAHTTNPSPTLKP